MTELLTAERLRSLLDYDAHTGIFVWRVNANRRTAKAGDVAGCVTAIGYRCISIGGRIYKAHRLAWLHTYGTWPQNQIDHIDRNPSNNAIGNLRDVSPKENCQNAVDAMGHNKSTGIRGVSWNKARRRYVVSIMAGGRVFHQGRFKKLADAQSAYLSAKRKYHPTFHE